VGGDWYDVFPLPAGRVALAVGDVVGHGIDAAAVMGQLRTALRAYAIEGHEPAAVVDRVSSLMWHLGPHSMTTLAYIVVDLAGESLELVNAGHPPPLVVGPTGTAEFVPTKGGIALGATPSAVYRAETFALPTGAIVFLYTDGLVEVRGESIDAGLERLRELAAGFTQVEALCSAVAEHIVPEVPADDIAFIAARIPPLADELTRRWPATPDVLAGIRRLLRRWLSDRKASEDEIYDITVACQEACANAIEHAYAPGPAAFELGLAHDRGVVRLTIRDQGRWRDARGDNRGRGLPLMRELMDTVDVRESPEGTEVVLCKHLGGTP
jgi:anti-sigma regulatory factor (Ser/Thr protein kinase)